LLVEHKVQQPRLELAEIPDQPPDHFPTCIIIPACHYAPEQIEQMP
jgi:hypothetical protein